MRPSLRLAPLALTKAGDVLVQADVLGGRTGAPVTLTLDRAGKPITVKYRPVGLTADGQGWTRVPGVADDACTR